MNAVMRTSIYVILNMEPVTINPVPTNVYVSRDMKGMAQCVQVIQSVFGAYCTF